MTKPAEVVVELEGFPQEIIERMLFCERRIAVLTAEIDKLRNDILAADLMRQDEWRKAEAWLRERGMTHLDGDGIRRQVKIDYFNRKAFHKTIL